MLETEINYIPNLIYILFGFLAQADVSSNCGINFRNNKDLYNKFMEYAIHNSPIYCDLINNEYDIAKVGEAIELPVSASSIIWSSFQCFDNKEKNSINCYYDSLSNIKIKDDGRYYVFSVYSFGDKENLNLVGMINNGTVASDKKYIGDKDFNKGFTDNLYINANAVNVEFEYIKFDDCELVCNYATEGFDGVYVTNLTFRNCEIAVDTDKKFIDWGGDAYCGKIEFINCEFYSKNSTSLEYYADSFISVTNNNGMSFKDCTFNNTKNGAIRINKSTNCLGEIGTFELDNCIFNNCLNKVINFEYLDHANNARIYSTYSIFNYDNAYLKNNSIYQDCIYFNIIDANRPSSSFDYSRIVFTINNQDSFSFTHFGRYYGSYYLNCTIYGLYSTTTWEITNHGIDPD